VSLVMVSFGSASFNSIGYVDGFFGLGLELLVSILLYASLRFLFAFRSGSPRFLVAFLFLGISAFLKFYWISLFFFLLVILFVFEFFYEFMNERANKQTARDIYQSFEGFCFFRGVRLGFLVDLFERVSLKCAQSAAEA